MAQVGRKKLSSRAAKSAEGVNFLSAYRWASFRPQAVIAYGLV
jgi:hypothetical protein